MWANYSSSTLPGLGKTLRTGWLTDRIGDLTTNTSIDNANRSWLWIVCNQMGFLQESALSGYPMLVSHLIQPIYDERQCQQMFPAAFSSPPVPDVEKTTEHMVDFTSKQTGFSLQLVFMRLLHPPHPPPPLSQPNPPPSPSSPFTLADCHVCDPWRFATMSADGIYVQSTPEQPIVKSDTFHCSDLITKDGLADLTVLNVQTQGLKYIGEWLSTWEPPLVLVKVNVDLNFKHCAYLIPQR
ncbi:hypothetical protein B0F90DRAFT_1871169 [Multifurca ochricompacta]|uniref:Uncharacterized protein n=1 Tax=Multifurca ochricompacta TaxID=376703 RepID=A0AAD4LU61_9AGAM|nr:hypothetical protein B0F90DRAFT_1871169 [Multifurca ochricompacta]